MMGVSELHYYDLYAPLVASVDLTYPTEQASGARSSTALKPLGPDYAAVVKRAFNERWIDVYPTEGKRSGAYSNGGAYDVHPYMLLNYNGKYTDVSTLAHELGHAMHSYYSNKTQPYATASYPIFLAEVASTFNEALLIDHMLKTITDRRRRSSRCSATISRASKAPCSVKRSSRSSSCGRTRWPKRVEPLTGEALDKLYGEITRKYYGHDKGVTQGRRLHRARMGIHPALLPQLTTSSSTRPPLPRRRHCRKKSWPGIPRRPSAT